MRPIESYEYCTCLPLASVRLVSRESWSYASVLDPMASVTPVIRQQFHV
jgi:hypothetical protein